MEDSRWRFRLDVAATAAMLVAAIVMVYVALRPATIVTSGRAQPQTKAPPTPPDVPVGLGLAEVKGSTSAKVAVIEFSDFECPFCRRFSSDTWPIIDKEYVASGKVLFAFRHLPIESIHRDAMKSAEAAHCAGKQDRFWPFHDRLFQDPMPTGMESLVRVARDLGLDEKTFSSCLGGPKTDFFARSVADAKQLGITSTPTFFIGSTLPDGQVKVLSVIRGAEALPVFKKALDALLGAQ